MNEDYKNFRRRIKRMCRPSVVQLCKDAGLNDRETDMITMFYLDGHSEYYISDHFNMSRSAYHENKKMLIARIMDYQEYIAIKSKVNDRGGRYV